MVIVMMGDLEQGFVNVTKVLMGQHVSCVRRTIMARTVQVSSLLNQIKALSY